MTAAMVLIFFATPPYDSFVGIFTENDVSGFFSSRFLPEESWFGLDVKLQKLALFFENFGGVAPAVDSMPVGSLPDTPTSAN